MGRSKAIKRSCIEFSSRLAVLAFIVGAGCAPTSTPPAGLDFVERGTDADRWDLDRADLKLKVRRVFYAEPVLVADGTETATVTIELFARPGPVLWVRAYSELAVAVGDQVITPSPYSSSGAWHGRMKAPLTAQDGAPITFGLYSGNGPADLYQAQEEDTGLRYDPGALLQYWVDEEALRE